MNSIQKYSIGWWIGILFAVLYSWGASHGPQAADSAEFMMVAGGGGRLHPPGYPALQLWLLLWQYIPFGTVAWKASAACGLLGAIALGLLGDVIQRITESRIASLWSVLLLGVQPLWLRYCTMAEAFSIAALVYSMLLWLTIRVEKETSREQAILLGLILAVGIASHHVFLFAAPLYGWMIWKLREHIVWIVGLSILGFLAYLPLLSANGVWLWGNVQSIKELIPFFLRADYGSFQITHSEISGVWWENPLLYLRYWMVDSWGVFPVLTLVTLYCRREFFIWLIFAAWILSSCGLFVLFSIPSSGDYALHTQRFFVAPTLLSIPLVALGFQQLLQTANKKMIWFSFSIPVAFAILYVPQIPARFDKRMADFLHNACTVLPDDALVFVEGDGAIFGFHYLQSIEGQCQNIEFIVPGLLTYDWYRPDVTNRSITGIIVENPERAIFASLSILGSYQEQLPAAVPYGGVWMRFVTAAEDFPSPMLIEVQLLNAMNTFQYHKTPQAGFLWERVGESWAAGQYAHSWLALAHAYRQAEMMEAANRCQQIAEALRKGEWFVVE